jgi:hypothetical protein
VRECNAHAKPERCVRSLVEAVGGIATDECFWIIDVFVVRWSWDQIQVIAAHPRVHRVARE